MPCAANETAAAPATTSSKRHHPNPPPDIIAEEPEWASARRDAILEQLSASIAEINQPISAVVMNAEAAMWLLQLRPTDMEAIGRLLPCIVRDGMRAGDIANRTRALIKKAPVGAATSPTDVDPDRA
jgi:hypothetical protein